MANDNAKLMIDPARVYVPSDLRTRNAAPTAAMVEPLATAIKANGQLQPIGVRGYKGDQDFDYTLVFGENRLLACAKIESKVWAQEVAVKSDLDAITAAYSENHDRNTLTVMDKVHMVEMLERFTENGKPLTGKAIAQRMGVQQAEITRLKKIPTLSDAIKGYLSAGSLNAAQAMALLEVDEKKRDRIADKARFIPTPDGVKIGSENDPGQSGLTAAKILELARGGKTGDETPEDADKDETDDKPEKATKVTGQRSLSQVNTLIASVVNDTESQVETKVPLVDLIKALQKFIAGETACEATCQAVFGKLLVKNGASKPEKKGKAKKVKDAAADADPAGTE